MQNHDLYKEKLSAEILLNGKSGIVGVLFNVFAIKH